MLSFAKGVRVKNNEPKILEHILMFLAHHFHHGSQRRSSGSCNAVKVWHERLTCLGIEAKQQPTPNLETHFRCVQYVINSGGLFTHGSGKTLILIVISPTYRRILKFTWTNESLLCIFVLIVRYVMGPFSHARYAASNEIRKRVEKWLDDRCDIHLGMLLESTRLQEEE